MQILVKKNFYIGNSKEKKQTNKKNVYAKVSSDLNKVAPVTTLITRNFQNKSYFLIEH